MRNVFVRQAKGEDTHMPKRESPPSTPRWVKVFLILVLILVLLFVILHLTGHGIGPHMHMSTVEHGMRQL